jgi:MtrB/PioB family decaheme-associated outer membrane protein
MNTMRSLVAAATLILLPAEAFADGDYELTDAPAKVSETPVYRNEVTIGGIYQSAGSPYFGRWDGRVNPGLYGNGGFSLHGGDDWDSGGTYYYSFEGNNLGLDSRSLDLKFGQWGSWGVRLYYDQIPYNAVTGFKSAWQQGSGNLVSGIAPGSLGNDCLNSNPSTCKAPLSNPSSLGSYDIGTERYIMGGEGKLIIGDWQVSTSIRHELKQGTQQGSLVYSTGGPPTPQSAGVAASLSGGPTILGGKPANNGTFTSALAFFAQPVEYTTDRIDVTAQYSGERLQALLGYVFMNFDNGDQLLALQNPFAFTSTFNTLNSPASIVSAYSLPPSNSAHQWKAQVGYNLGPKTRVNANFQFGLQMQNQQYPLTTLSAGSPALAEPRTSLDGLIETFNGNLAITSTPIDRLDLRLAYTLDDRNNLTPRNVYENYRLDSSTIEYHENEPFSYERNSIAAEAGYRVLPTTKVTLTYNFDLTHRTYVNTVNTSENTVTAKVRSQLMDNLFATLSYQFADRDAHNYNPLGGPDQETCATAACVPDTVQFDYLGFQRFYLASRTRNEVKSTLDYTPFEGPLSGVSVSLMAKYTDDYYPNDDFGLRSNTNVTVGPDINWEVRQGLNFHAYYNFQQIFFNQNSMYWTANVTPPCETSTNVPLAGCNGAWNNKTTDTVHTFGISADWAPRPDLSFGIDYNLAYGDSQYVLADNGVLAFGNCQIATLCTTAGQQTALASAGNWSARSLNSILRLRGEWKIRPNISLIGGIGWDRMYLSDPSQVVAPTQYTNALLPGDLNPNYSIGSAYAMIRYRF